MKCLYNRIIDKIEKKEKKLFKACAAIIMIVVIALSYARDSFAYSYSVYTVKLSIPPLPTSSSELKACFASNWKVTDSSSTSYFSPSIDVRHDLCLFCVCGRETNTLSAFGQCALYPGTGFVRACARLTLPGTYDADLWNDPPTTPAHYPPNGMAAAMANELPLVCGFEDPMSPADGNDWSAYSMPFHKNSPPNSGGAQAKTGQVSTTLLAVGVVTYFFCPEAGVLLVAAGAIALAISNSPINQVVIANHGCVQIPMAPYPPPFNNSIPNLPMDGTGVNICSSTYNSDFTTAGLTASGGSTTNLTTTSPTAALPTSTVTNPCELSGTYQKDSSTPVFSTFEQPIGRVAFTNPMGICQGNYPTTGTPTCVQFSNASSVTNSFSYNNLGLIAQCSPSDTNPCFSFPGSVSGLTGAGNGPFRADYQCPGAPSNVSSSVSNLPWSLITNPVTGNLYNISCTSLSLTGIEYAQFTDLSVSFAAGNVNATASNVVPVTDVMGNTKYVYAQSVDAESPSKICLFAQNSNTPAGWPGQPYSDPLPTDPNASSRPVPVGCFDRPQMPLPIVADCGDTINATYNGHAVSLNQSCSSSTAAPAIAFGLGYPFQQKYLKYVPGSNAQMPFAYLHGYRFTLNLTDRSYSDLDVYGNKFGKYTYTIDGSGGSGQVVDTTYSTQTGTKNQNAIISQLKGGYVDSSGQLRNSVGGAINSMIDANGTAIYYQDGLEYIYSSYIRGAKRICLEGYQTKGQVLANIVTQNAQTALSPAVAPPGASQIVSAGSSITSKLVTDRIVPAYNSSETYPLTTNYISPLVVPDGSGGFTYSGGSNIPPQNTMVINTATQAARPTNSMEDGLCIDMACKNSQASYPNATSTNSTGTTEIGQTLAFTCNSGAMGSITATCQYPGWSYSGSCTQICKNQDLPLTDSGANTANTGITVWWFINNNKFYKQSQMAYNSGDSKTYTNSGVTITGSCYVGDGGSPEHSTNCLINNINSPAPNFICNNSAWAGAVATCNNGTWTYRTACDWH